MDEKLARDVLSLGTNLLNPKPTVRNLPEPSPRFHKDNAIVGVTLNDYTDREPSEDGQYVKVTVHRERIELIEQPLTPEELAEEKEKQKMNFRVGAVVAAGLVGVAGILQVLDRKSQRKVEVKTSAR